MINKILIHRIIVFTVCLAITAGILSLTNVVNAEGNTAGFYVSADLPDNQLNKNVSYFDLRVKPSMKQTLKINIYNERNEDLQLSVYAANASSNSNGIIEYTNRGITDASLKIPFETIAEPEEELVVIPAGSKKVFGVDLHMPDEKFDGMILGGLVFTEIKDKKEDAKKSSMMIDNLISYALAVKLSQDDKIKNINLDLMDVKSRTVDGEPVITHFITNDAPALSTKMKVKINILDADTLEKVGMEVKDNVSIAPNSTMPFSFRLKDKPLKEGNYISKVTISYTDKSDKEQKNEYEKEFSINKDQAKEARDYHEALNPTPMWAKLIIAGLGILILCVVILIMVMVRRKKADV